MPATSSGWEKYGSPEARELRAVRLSWRRHRLCSSTDLVRVGIIGPHAVDQGRLPDQPFLLEAHCASLAKVTPGMRNLYSS